MKQFLVAIHRPTDYDPTVSEDEAMHREIDALNEAMVAAGIREFVGGLRSEREARAIRRTTDGSLLISDGPYLETKEHIGGFWVLKLATIEEAIDWGRTAAVACRASVEVRPFHGPSD